MVNRPKQIGTAGETAIVRYAQASGHTLARREVLHGNTDQGDIRLTNHIILEVKSGHTAEQASDAQLATWWAETIRERDNAHVPVGVLITKRKGASGARCGAWNAHMDADTLLTLLGAQRPAQHAHGHILVHMSVDSMLALTTTHERNHQ